MPVMNFGFEIHSGGANIPFWTKETGIGGVSINESEDRVYSGSKSLNIYDLSSSGAVRLRSANIDNIIPGRAYHALVHCFIEQGKAGLEIQFWSGGVKKGSNKSELSTIGIWDELTVQADAPEGTEFITITLFTTEENIGSVYFDHIELLELPNFNIEENPDSLGMPSFWNVFSGIEYISVSDTSIYEGSKSLKICKPADEASLLLYSPEAGAFTERKTTAMNCRLKVYEGELLVAVEALGSSGNVLGRWEQLILTKHHWQTCSFFVNLPENCTSVRMLFNVPFERSCVAMIDKLALDRIIEVKSVKQLFFDDHIVSSHTMIRKIHPGVKGEIALEKDVTRPWETRRATFAGSTLLDGDRLRMWYRGISTEGQRYVCHAESFDGVEWHKTLYNYGVFPDYASNNLVRINDEFGQPLSNLESVSVTKKDNTYYMLAYETALNTYSSFTSPDGFVWDPVLRNCIYNQDAVYSDVATCTYDHYNDRFVANVKIPSTDNYFMFKRDQYSAESDDMFSFSEPDKKYTLADRTYYDRYMAVLGGTSISSVESYGMGLFPYEGNYIGFNWLFFINRKMGYAYDEGVVESQLVFSRDLKKQWQIPFSSPVLRLGEAGEWDDGMIFTASSPMVFGDIIQLYYAGWDDQHGTLNRESRIGSVKWRLDGFVSMESLDDEHYIQSVPLITNANSLYINADCADGYCLAELCSENGEPLPGYSREECDPIRNDSCRILVTWNGDPLIGIPENTPVVLKLYASMADVFSFQFTQSEIIPTRVELANRKPAGEETLETTKESVVKVFPVPAETTLNISGILVRSEAVLYTESGREVARYRLDPGSNTLDVGFVSSGAYFLRIESSEQSGLYRVIKN